MPSFVLPEVDMLTVSRSSRNQRKSIRDFLPKIGLATVDYGACERIETFYSDCQDYRDYYRDPYNKLSKPVSFKTYYGKCGVKQDKNTAILLEPVKWVQEEQPIYYPVDGVKDRALANPPDFRGIYNRDTCSKFKR